MHDPGAFDDPKAVEASSAAFEEPGGMTLTRLRRIVTLLSNGCFVRYWIGFRRAREGTLMALCCINEDGAPAGLYEADLQREGFVKQTPGRLEFWVIRRVDEEGNPWRGRLPIG